MTLDDGNNGIFSILGNAGLSTVVLLRARMRLMWEFPKIRGTLFWGRSPHMGVPVV